MVSLSAISKLNAFHVGNEHMPSLCMTWHKPQKRSAVQLGERSINEDGSFMKETLHLVEQASLMILETG